MIETNIKFQYEYICIGGPLDGAMVESAEPLTHFDGVRSDLFGVVARYVCVKEPELVFDGYLDLRK